MEGSASTVITVPGIHRMFLAPTVGGQGAWWLVMQVMGPLASYLTSLSLSFLSIKQGLYLPCSAVCKDKMKYNDSRLIAGPAQGGYSRAIHFFAPFSF